MELFYAKKKHKKLFRHMTIKNLRKKWNLQTWYKYTSELLTDTEVVNIINSHIFLGGDVF